jgi:hypothetical protein
MGTVFREEDAQSPAEAAAAILAMLAPGGALTTNHGELLQFGKIIDYGEGGLD